MTYLLFFFAKIAKIPLHIIEGRGHVLTETFPFLFFSKSKGEISSVLENTFQAKLIKELKEKFPGCLVLKNDPNYIQGFPDLTVLYKDKWALLEAKKERKASRRPNQDFYIEKADEMSFGRFISPENKEEVLHELQQAFES